MVVRLRGEAATARHRAEARANLRRERKRMKEHVWKTNPATLTEWYRNTSSRNRFNDFPPQNASQCEPVNAAVRQRFRGDLTQFLHSSHVHLSQYVVALFSTG